MSVIDPTAARPTRGHERTLSGWGQVAPGRCRVVELRDGDDVARALSGRSPGAPSGGLIARGAGRSYGDAAQNTGGVVLDMTALDEIVSVDAATLRVVAQAGVTIAELLARLSAHGLTLPVVPGTSQITLGGAIASDIHGKNHHRDGGFARHVASLSLLTPAGGVSEISPESDPALFYATFGGMGLTGVILQATIRVEPMSAPWVAADTDRTDGLEETLALMSGDADGRYSVAWLDLLAAGSKRGRAVVSRADPLPPDVPAPATGRRWWPRPEYARSLQRGPAFDVPARLPGSPLFPAGVRAFNALHWRSSPRRERARPVAFVPYFFPLDVLGHWSRLYGAGGLIQYQFVLPLGSHDALERCFALIHDRRLPVYLAVFKRFGPAFGGPLSFPIEGWTLAIDIPAGAPGLYAALDELDGVIAGAGGRVYLSKDARLRPDVLRAMYPALDAFNSVRAQVDPGGVLRSDLARRLGLCEAGG